MNVCSSRSTEEACTNATYTHTNRAVGHTYLALVVAAFARCTLRLTLQLACDAIAAWIICTFLGGAAIALFVVFDDFITAIAPFDFQLQRDWHSEAHRRRT